MFLPLTKEEIADVVRLQLNAVSRMLEQQGLKLRVTDEAVAVIAEAGFDPEFGARPVKRTIQRDVLNLLSKRILAEEVSRDNPIIVDAHEGQLVFSN